MDWATIHTTIRRDNVQLPEGFLVGAATSGIQTEGFSATSDFWTSEWRSTSQKSAKSGDACNSWDMWQTDIDLLADSGLNTYRFGIEWARIQPEVGFTSKAAILHYRRMVEYCRSRGVEPLLTLYHFAVPQWFADEGGWLSEHANERFVAYLDAISPILDAGVSIAVTINEPNSLAFERAFKNHGTWGKPGFEGALPPADPGYTAAMVSAHDAARDHLRSTHPDLKTGWSVASQAPVAVEEGGEPYVEEFFNGVEKPFLEAARGDDFVGVQSYTRARFGASGYIPLSDADPQTINHWEFYPPALGIALHETHAVLPETPIIVTENGTAVNEDDRRIEYTTGALHALGHSLNAGIDIRGYTHWSLLDNWEFGSFKARFGLVSFDPETFERTAKPSLAWLGNVAKTGEIPD